MKRIEWNHKLFKETFYQHSRQTNHKSLSFIISSISFPTRILQEVIISLVLLYADCLSVLNVLHNLVSLALSLEILSTH